MACGEVAMQWEERLMEEMFRLKTELEQMYSEMRIKELDDIRRDFARETQQLTDGFRGREQELKNEVRIDWP